MARIRLLSGPARDEEITVPPSGLTIGRSANCDLPISDGKVSSQHAVVRLFEGLWWLYDLQSSNGTFVNGKEVQGVALREGDTIAVGETEILFLSGDAAGEPAPSPVPPTTTQHRAAPEPPAPLPEPGAPGTDTIAAGARPPEPAPASN
jgi:pSer/pThr/pTyr-binding forkhead associated (FHA) protein